MWKDRPVLRSLLAVVVLLVTLARPGLTQAGSGASWHPDELTWHGISQRRLNDTRDDAGLPLLAADTYLWGLARERARDMLARDYLAATTPEGLDAGAYMRQDGARYDAWTEFRADDSSSDPEERVAWRVIDGILNDTGGRASALGPFDRLGVALAERPGRRVFVVVIASAAPDAPAASAGRDEAIVALARQYTGARYRFGGSTPAGFDCSGFVRFVVLQATGILLGRDVVAQASAGVPVEPANLRPGDLVFEQNTYLRGLAHVGIYIGDGKMISAENERTGVRIASIWDSYWGPRFHSARRVT
jgi:cell wall-associated NlpC family hydrolase